MFASPDEPLQCAQERKLRTLAHKAGVQAGHRVLEIGFGWGSLSLLLAKHFGAIVTGITLSEQQLALAQGRVDAAGLGDRVTFHLADYRLHVPAGGRPYDRILSCEMLEAVGHEYLPDYFHHCARLLSPTGLLVVQVITTPEERYEAYRQSSDFIKEYIFPGCCCPSLSAVTAAAGTAGGFVLAGFEDIGPHYAPTLLRWREAFMGNQAAVRRLGFSAAFIRAWDYYLSYCSAGFATRTLGDLQLVFTRPGNVASLGGVRFKGEPKGPSPAAWW
jgi:cyclopropane-fatty-acyl-phospholipid synthase